MNTHEKITGKCSTFGGRFDSGVGSNEGLALVENGDAQDSKLWRPLFIQPVKMNCGLARQLDSSQFYCAMRWNYSATPKRILAASIVRVMSGSGRVCWCRPVDYGPNERTGRVIDLSPGAASALGVGTDDVVTCELFV